MASTIALTQDSGGKEDISSNKNKEVNEDALDDTDSGNNNGEVDKTGNDNMRQSWKNNNEEKQRIN